jgi:ABC-type lipoprotein release transport system permease subunit
MAMAKILNKKPPLWAAKLLVLLSHNEDRYSLIDDLEIEFRDFIVEKGWLYAWFWYVLHVIRAVPEFVMQAIYWRIVMFKNYFKIAMRNIKKHKGYSFINIFGLAVGMTCCVLILLWVQHEASFDSYHERSKDIYRVLNDLQHGPFQGKVEGSGYPVGAVMKEEFPEVLEAVRFRRSERLLVASGEKRIFETRFYFADPSVFRVFSFPFINGNPETALLSRESIVITENMALKYFGNEDPMGKTIRTKNQHDYTISGVIANIPPNSHFQFDFLAPLERAVELGYRVHWTGWFYRTYVLLHPGTSYKALNIKLKTWMESKPDEASTYYLQPLRRIHLFGIDGDGVIRFVYLFSSLAILVLLIACINHINLSTACASHRAKEIGLRKVVGAQRQDIVKQYLGESIILALFSMIVAILLVGLFLPIFDQISGKPISENLAQAIFIIPGLLFVTIFTGLIAGSYPALFLSTLQPVKIIQGFLTAGTKNPLLRKVLVVTQFTLSIVLMVCSLVVYFQLQYISHRNLGFDEDHLVYLELKGTDEQTQRYDALKTALLQQSGVRNVTAGTGLPFGGLASEFGQLDWKGKDSEQQISMYHIAVKPDFLRTFQLEMKDGEFFSDRSDSDRMDFILNEAGVKATGLESPLGERFRLLDRSGRIIGVIKDFHFSSLHQRIEPLVIAKMPFSSWMYSHFVFVRINSDNIQRTLASMKDAWNEVVPESPFVFNFLDTKVNEAYRSERALGRILQSFTYLALIISCLGLFGLASFMVEKRKKEIGIRKVMGASTTRIVRLFSGEFVALILVANLIAVPITVLVMNTWLQNFAYRVDIEFWMFAFSAMVTLIVAFISVGYKSIYAALANPVDSLRYE